VYSLLYVRIAESTATRPQSDLTARARIRDAAIACFAEEGFTASVRAIATRAGVSPGLVTHHFGSKAALRDECDAEVLGRYQELKLSAITAPNVHLSEHIPATQGPATLLVYLLRAVLAGGPASRVFLDRLIEDMRPVMAAGVASGVVRPSRDEEARLRYLSHQSIGALLVQFVTHPGTSPAEFADSLSDDQHGVVLPMLELFCEGLMTDRQMLDDYLENARNTR
jgi:AcrR family transcriptional regulator